jgi:peptide/nickel transport system substrate-binding protein
MLDLTRRQLGLGFGAALMIPAVGRAQAIKRGGTLTMALPTEPPTLVSLTTTAQSSVILSAKVTEGLLSYDFDLKPQPQLATAWSMTSDGLQYAFTLRQGVKWHDGQDFTSADVAFSIMLLKQVHPRGQSTFQNLDRVETPDPFTAIFVLNKPAPYLLTALLAAESPIVARHIYAPSGDAVAANPNELAPVGTGPFVFKEWVHGSHVIYERNPHYWDEGKPYLDRFIARFMTDASARSIALETGEVDVAGWSPVPLTDVKRLSQLPNLVIETHGNEYQNNLFYRIEFNTENPYFRDVRVRQAIAHALDKRVILMLAFLGYGVIANGPISPNLKAFFDVDLPSIPYDTKKAEALLDEAGFPRGSGGVRFSVHQEAQAGAAVDIAQYTKDALRRIGIDVTVRTEDISSYVRRLYTTREFDFSAQGSTQMFDPTVGTQRFYWSRNIHHGVPYSNGAAYANPDADRALEAAAIEVDPAKRRQDFNRFQEIINTDVPAIGLVAQSQITIAQKRVVNHTITADGVSANYADVYLNA